MAEFGLSHLVRLVGLNNADYNDKLAQVISLLDPMRGRHLVHLIEGEVSSRLRQDIHVKPENMRHVCNHCHLTSETKMQICGKCRVVRYCNKDCQRNDWSSHKVHCEEHGLYRELTKKPLFDAIRTRNLMEVQRLVEQGADVKRTLSSLLSETLLKLVICPFFGTYVSMVRTSTRRTLTSLLHSGLQQGKAIFRWCNTW